MKNLNEIENLTSITDCGFAVQRLVRRYRLMKQYPNSNASIGEIVELSIYGEYCPDNSLRGYSPDEIEKNPCWKELEPRGGSLIAIETAKDTSLFLWGRDIRDYRVFKNGKPVKLTTGNVKKIERRLRYA